MQGGTELKGLTADLRVEGVGTKVEVMREACVSARGTALVVDGLKQRITPLRHTIVPPPMCAASVLLPQLPHAVAWCNRGPREVPFFSLATTAILTRCALCLETCNHQTGCRNGHQRTCHYGYQMGDC